MLNIIKDLLINKDGYLIIIKLKKLDPFVCYDKNDSSSILNVSFTPYDCYNTYMKLEDIFEDEIEELEPDEYFKPEKMITLDEVKEYEKLLKNKVIDLQKKIILKR